MVGRMAWLIMMSLLTRYRPLLIPVDLEPLGNIPKSFNILYWIMETKEPANYPNGVPRHRAQYSVDEELMAMSRAMAALIRQVRFPHHGIRPRGTMLSI